MKLKVILSFVLTSLLILSCKESAIDPQPGDGNIRDQRMKILNSNNWVLANTDEPKDFNPCKVFFNSDSSFEWFGLFPEYSSEKPAKWTLSVTGDTLILIGKVNEKFSIEYIDNSTFKIKNSDGKSAEFWAVQNKDFKMAIVGKIDNKIAYNLNSNCEAVCLWPVVTGEHGDKEYVWGKGYLDLNKGRFFILFNSDIPENLKNNFNGSNYKFALAYILLTNQQVEEGLVEYNENELDSKIIGVINNSALIFKEGGSDQTSYPLWLSSMKDGWNFAKGVKSDEGFDYFEEASPTNLIMKIDKPENFEMVNWY